MESNQGMILIVDDRPENLLPLRKILENHQFRTDSAGSGEDALKKVLKHSYSLIIMDVQMPDMDGFEVAETIAGYSKVKDIPILFLSAVNRDKRFITRGYESGGIDYLTKPVDPDILILKVKTFYKLYEQKQQLKTIQQSLTREIEERKKAQESLASMNETLEEKITQRTHELLEKNRELKRAYDDLEQFTWVVSHDLREPLRKIQTFNGMIRDRFVSGNEKASSFLEKSIHAAERLTTLIEDLLTYSKLSAQREFAKLSLRKLADEAVAELGNRISACHAVVEVGRFPEAEVIPGHMKQVFHQLIDNALKFRKPGSEPHIRIEGCIVEDSDENSPESSNGSYCRVTVTDNGIGFNTRYLDRIFSIFQRLHERGDYDGTGMGLALVKKIMDIHKGLIRADSRENEGSVFTLIFPLEQQHHTLNAKIVQ